MAKKTGTLIKEARTGAGFTQEELARKISGLTASDISKAERGEKDLTQDQLKKIAKACGVTQSSLLNAEKTTAKKSTAKKTVTTAKKTTAAAKKTASSTSSLKLTVAEKQLVELYRKAEKEDKEKVMKILKGEDSSILDIIGSLLS